MDAEKHVSLEEIEEYNSVVNQMFVSEKDGYKFYNSYAAKKGFSVRKEKVRYKAGTKKMKWRRFCCSSEGHRLLKFFERTDQQREPRALTRCGCNAKLDIELNEESGLWFVKDFVDGHCHVLCKPEDVFVMRSHRGLNDAQKAEAIELGIGGLRTCQIMDVMEKNHGSYEETGFLLRDLYNFFARYKKERVEGRDAEFVLKYMGGKQEEDPEYFFKYSVDDEGHLKKKNWADAQSRIDYHAFGDVIIFDSTYRVNRYNLPFVPFIGLNHHRSTVVFGCGIISDESVSSYVWLLEAFLEAMGQHHPESVITDGDIAMARAIEIVMPEADHRLCSWHIEQNMIHRLRGEKLSEFRKFVYHPMTVDNFEKRWMEYKENYGISEEDIWMVMMYDLRKKWSAAYTKGRHFLGMQSNQRSESLNSRLHKHLDRKMSLVDLVEHYEFSLSRIRRNEAELDAKASLSVPFTRISADIFEKKAARIYTPKMFKKVREQIRGLCQWEVKEVTPENGLVKYGVGSEGVREDLVYVICIFDGTLMQNASCFCRLMEGEAIPCAHIFAVMRFLGFDNIPKCCVVERWTNLAKIAFPSDRVTNTHVRSEQMARFRGLRNKANLALFKASKSEEQSERVMRFLDEVLEEGEGDDGSMEATSFGPLPAHFSGANQRFVTEVLDPNKIVAKGAPSNKRLKRFHERLRRN
ncbi:protein FAR1-RELATED SEQUENCE 5-like [Phragmites australis]|uniref:protein FAR1-RELATED SEQUENCE 5-like n=1 Tax=Phragmites australis TaxID=29695 RepID=UPI002D785B6F|nr:protein FAR1-RELATED SEQUENCE 5-like [Phragmites australis]